MARKRVRCWPAALHPAYYIRKPRRLVFLCIFAVLALYALMEGLSQSREIQTLNQRLQEMQSEKRELQSQLSKAGGKNVQGNMIVSELKSYVAGSLPNFTSAGVATDARSRPVPWAGMGGGSAADPTATARRQEVKEAMMYAWSKYEEYAWGMDELQPLSRRGTNLFGGLGATIIDSLDTLYIMGLTDQFAKARDWVATSLSFDKHYEASVFETTIRVVGGLVAAYDLSGDAIFLEKAKDLGDRLLPAFETPSGIPRNVINLATGASSNQGWTGGSSTLADFGTEHLEFIALSQRTGDPKYKEKAERVIEVVRAHFPENGLCPIFWDTNSGYPTAAKISFGAMGDSFYEYLLKVWVQGGKTEHLQYLRDMWETSVRGMIDQLLQRSEPNKLLYVAEMQGGALIHKMDHLACFLGGMFVLGAEGEHADEYMDIAKGLTATCYQFYSRMSSGLSGEHYLFNQGGNDFIVGHAYSIQRPETVESLFYLWRRTKDPIYRDWGWQIFQAFQKRCRTDAGYTGLRDVSQQPPMQDDMQQSFFMAETLKYLYLLFSDDDVMPLDKWVFNTEAHPIRVAPRVDKDDLGAVPDAEGVRQRQLGRKEAVGLRGHT